MSDKDILKIFRFHPKVKDRLVIREGGSLELKESFSWNSRDKYGKTIAAFANNKGGLLVFGVKDEPRELIGLKSNNFEQIDEAKIAEYLNSIFVPEILFEKLVITIRKKQVGILIVEEAANKPVVGIKNDGDIQEATIYYRYNARNDKIKFPELKFLIDKEKSKVEDKWKSLLQSLGKIHDITNATVVNTSDASPVRITSDLNAPVVRVAEDPTIGGYRLRYHEVISEMHKRSKTFKANIKFVDLIRELAKEERFCRVRYLYPGNSKGPKTRYFHPRILKEIEKRYKTYKNANLKHIEQG